MMSITADPYGFLQASERVAIDGFSGQLVICYFEVNNYSPKLLAYYDIELPLALKSAAKKRLAEFVAGRIAARQALQQLGCHHHSVVGRADDGRPLWPQSVIGSISHQGNSACCAVAWDTCYTVLGVDIEQYMTAGVAANTQALIMQPKEHAIVQQLMHGDESLSAPKMLTLLFSAKESLYKALYPAVLKYFDFLDASVRVLDRRQAYFSLGLDVDLTKNIKKDDLYAGRFLLRENDLLTLVFQ